MTDRLDIARFRELADAYGGVVARWPEQYRDAAGRMAGEADAAAVLAGALMLDETLDTWRVPAVTGSLIGRVVASGPAAVRRSLPRIRLWWAGAGFSAALAGAAVGVAVVVATVPSAPTATVPAPETGTSFGDVAGQDS